MSDSEQDDRRKHSRTPLSLLVQFRFNTFEDFLADYSVNISPGGMFIRTDEPQEEGSIIYLQFTLKDGSRLIEGMGKVVRCNPPGQPGRTIFGGTGIGLDVAIRQQPGRGCHRLTGGLLWCGWHRHDGG